MSTVAKRVVGDFRERSETGDPKAAHLNRLGRRARSGARRGIEEMTILPVSAG
jgi:hypothetical protein